MTHASSTAATAMPAATLQMDLAGGQHSKCMMRKLMLGSLAIALIAMTGTVAGPASAQVAGPRTATSIGAPAELATTVQYRRGWRGNRRHYRGGYNRRDRWGPAVGLGIAGVVIGSALASRAHADQAVAYCMDRFNSYDPASGTYLGYDGYRHSCP